MICYSRYAINMLDNDLAHNRRLDIIQINEDSVSQRIYASYR